MAIYRVNCPHCLEVTTHEAEDDMAAAKQHGESRRHFSISGMNDALRASGISDSMISPKGPKKASVQEFVHGKDHNKEGN